MASLNFVFSKYFERFIITVILVNAITLGLETSKSAMSHFGPLLLALDHAALAIFTIELILKILSLRLRFVNDPWNIFDFVIVAVSYISSVTGLAVLRSFRVLRLLLLISAMPRLRIIVRSLIISLPNIASIALLLLLIFFVFAVIATNLFGRYFPEWFGTLPDSLFTLFQLMTMDSWASGIVRQVVKHFHYAAFFFVPFVLFTAYIVLNIFIAVIINGMNEAREQELKAERIQKMQNAPTEDLERIYLKLDDIGEELGRISSLLKKIKEAQKGLPH